MIFAPLVLLAGVSASAFVNPIAADPSALADSGSYQVYIGDRNIGGETFRFENRRDSVVVFSEVVQMYRGPSGVDTVTKRMTLVARSFDFDLRSYESILTAQGHTLTRGLALEDTVLSSYREIDGGGSDDKLTRPPGTLYIVDPQVFVLYDLMCRNLNSKTFDTRPVSLYTLGDKDSMSMASAADLGSEPIRWGGRPVRARKLSISDADLEFFLWVSPEGHLLRLEQPAYGLRVERVAPAGKPSARTPRAPVSKKRSPQRAG